MRSRPFLAFARLAALAGLTVRGGAHADDWSFIDNGELKLGVRRDRGASISWLSESGSERNVLNHWDTGRCVQQSYYGETDGSEWAGRPWKWNPVQGGHYQGSPARVLAFEVKGTSLYSKTLPKHWATGAEIPEVEMEQWIELAGKSAHVRFRMTYRGTLAHPSTDQEIPAVFLDASLANLVFYRGDAPWTDAPLTRVVPGWPNQEQHFDEHWAAYVDDKEWGLGIFNAATKRATTYRYLPKDAPHEALCSYLAPLANFAVTPGFVFEYGIYLRLGTVAEIRSAFSRLPRK